MFSDEENYADEHVFFTDLCDGRYLIVATPPPLSLSLSNTHSMESLKNMKNWKQLTEEIGKKTIALEKENWNIEYTWIKAHAGHYGNELADKLAKEAAIISEICYNKIQNSDIEHKEREKSIEKWQQQWDNTTKGFLTK